MTQTAGKKSLHWQLEEIICIDKCHTEDCPINEITVPQVLALFSRELASQRTALIEEIDRDLTDALYRKFGKRKYFAVVCAVIGMSLRHALAQVREKKI